MRARGPREGGSRGESTILAVCTPSCTLFPRAVPYSVTWFKRDGAVRKPSATDVRTITQRLEDIEDDVVQLKHRFTRLQGTVTGALRRMERELDTAHEEEGDYAGEEGE